MEIRRTILNQLQSVVEEFTPLPFPDEVDDDTLLDIFWLDSVAFTSLIVRLEEELGFIPETILQEGIIPKTLGELVNLYTSHT